MMQVNILLLLLCTALVHQAFAGKVYTLGPTSVEVHTEQYLELVGGTNRTVTERCATYQTDHKDSSKFDTACFKSVHTDGDTFIECEVKFGDVSCNRCNVCQTELRGVGYDLDCFNIQPAENTNGCDDYTDMNIQKVLVDDEFNTQPFVFNATADALQTETPSAAPIWAFSTLVVCFLSMLLL